MRGRGILAALLGVALLLSACGETPTLPTESPTEAPVPSATPTQPPGTAELVLPWYSGESAHPLTGTNQANLNLAPLVYEGLFELDEHFAPHGVLCSGQSVSEDGLTWTFTLRPGAVFSDGTPLTGWEVVSSLQTAMGANSPYSARLGNVRGVREGDGGVVISLLEPNGNLPALLDIPVVKEGGGDPLGTGPYTLDREGGLLRKNTDWWKGAALPAEEITLYDVRATDALVQAFDTREISLAATDLTGANALGFSGNYEVWDYPTRTMLYVGYNAANGPCTDPALRRSLSAGFDRTTVARSLLSGHAQATALPFHPASASYHSTLDAGMGYDPQPLSPGLTLNFIVNTDNSYKLAVARFLAQALTQAGAEVNLRELTWEAYHTALTEGDFDLYLGQVRLTGDFDLSPLLRVGGKLNYGGYADPETEALLGTYLAANDTTRPAAAYDLGQKLGEMTPFSVLCFKNASLLTHWGKISGVKASQQNIFYGLEGWRLN